MKKAVHTARKQIERADRDVSKAVADVRDHPVVETAGTASEIADQPPLALIAAGTVAVGIARSDRRLAVTGVRMLVAHGIGIVIKSAIKGSIDRTRPDHAIDHGYKAEKGDSDAHHLSSFPSGHTVGAVAVTEAAIAGYPAAAPWLRAASGTVAAIQIPRCKHFVTDIAAGAVIGWLSALLAGAIVDRAAVRLQR